MKNIIKNKLVKNTSWIIFEKVFQMFISLVVGMLTARYLGPSNYGMISYIASFIAFATPICNLGMDAVLIKKIVDYPDNEGEYVGTAIIMEFIVSIISYIILVLIIVLTDFSDTTKIIVVSLQSLLLIAKSTEPIDYYFQSKLMSKYTSIAKITGYLIMSGYKLFLVFTQKSIEWFAFASSLDMIVIAILYIYIYKKKKGQKLKFNFEIGKKILKESYHFIFSSLLVVLYTQMDKMMLGKMLSNTDVGLYTAAATICTYWGFIPLAIINTFRPIIYAAKKNNTKYIEKLKLLYCMIFWISIFFCTVITFFSKPIILILYGKEFLAAKITLIIAVWYTIFAYLGTARGIWVVSENKNKYVKKFVLIGAVLNFILNYYLIPIYGINGAAFATLITQFTVAIIAPLFYKETRISTKYMIESIIFKGVNIHMLKQIKKNKIVRKIYFSGRKLYISILSRISPKTASIVFYNRCHKEKLNLNNPKTFNEKLMYLKINNYNKNKDVFKCSDKYLVRKYAMNNGVSEKNLPKLLKVYKNTKEINFDELPNKFVLKCSHGCGFNIICQNKENLDKKETIKKLKKWQKTKYGYNTAETHYTHIKPTIFCEEFIQNENGGFPNDYKIYCFNGEPKVVLVCSEREKKLRLNFFDLRWKELLIGTENYRGTNKIAKPKQFNEMMDIAKKVSKGFPYVRVDLYEYKGKAILGEMTFTPAGCVAQYYTEEGQKYLGKLLDINKQ